MSNGSPAKRSHPCWNKIRSSAAGTSNAGSDGVAARTVSLESEIRFHFGGWERAMDFLKDLIGTLVLTGIFVALASCVV